jgi:hypothetical protein
MMMRRAQTQVRARPLAMGILLAVLGFWLLSFGILAQGQLSQTLRVSPTRLDFGNVPVNTQSQSLSFTISNQGNLSVRVEIRPNCTGVQVSPTTADVAAGSSVTVRVTLNRINTPGQFLCTIVALTNDIFSRQGGTSNRAVFPSVEIRANITSPKLIITRINIRREGTGQSGSRRDVDFTQRSSSSGVTLTANFGELDIFERLVLEITVGNGGNAPMQLRSSSSSNQNIQIEGLIDTVNLNPGATRTLRVTLLPTQGGTIRTTITIEMVNAPTSVARRLEIRLEGTANTIFIQPNSAFLIFTARVQATASQTLTLRHQGRGGDLANAIVELQIERVTHQSGTGSSSSSRRDLFRFGDGTTRTTVNLGAGNSAGISIIYSPTEIGIDQGSIRVTVFQQRITGGKGRQVQQFIVNLRGSATVAAQALAVLQDWGVLGSSASEWHFFAQGSGITALRAEVFSLTGQRIYDSGLVPETTIRWHPTALPTRWPLANGTYLYRLTIQDHTGQIVSTEVRRLLLLR